MARFTGPVLVDTNTVIEALLLMEQDDAGASALSPERMPMEASGRRSLRTTIHNSAATKAKIAISRITSWLPAVVAPTKRR